MRGRRVVVHLLKIILRNKMGEETTTFNIEFGDLSFDKRQEYITNIAERMYRAAEEEGDQFLLRKEHEGESWQEAFMREYSACYYEWEDLEGEDLENYDWNQSLKDWLEDQAFGKLDAGFHNTKITVTI